MKNVEQRLRSYYAEQEAQVVVPVPPDTSSALSRRAQPLGIAKSKRYEQVCGWLALAASLTLVVAYPLSQVNHRVHESHYTLLATVQDQRAVESLGRVATSFREGVIQRFSHKGE